MSDVNRVDVTDDAIDAVFQHIIKFDKFHRPVERVLKSRNMQIIGFNGNNKVTIDIEGNFNISVEDDQYINMSPTT